MKDLTFSLRCQKSMHRQLYCLSKRTGSSTWLELHPHTIVRTPRARYFYVFLSGNIAQQFKVYSQSVSLRKLISCLICSEVVSGLVGSSYLVLW